jgi:hypothetical protein
MGSGHRSRRGEGPCPSVYRERAAPCASGARRVVAADTKAVSSQGALDVLRAAGVCAIWDLARHGAVTVDQQRALTNHGDQARAWDDSLAGGAQMVKNAGRPQRCGIE